MCWRRHRVLRTDGRARTGAAEPDYRRRPAKNRALWHQRFRCRSSGANGNRRAGGHASDSRQKLFDLVVRMDPKYRSDAHAIGDILVPAPAGNKFHSPSWRPSRNRLAHLSSTAKIIRVTSGFNFRSMAATWKEWSMPGKPPWPNPCNFPKATDWIGAANTASYWKRNRSSHHRTARGVADLLILFALYGNFKFPITLHWASSSRNQSARSSPSSSRTRPSASPASWVCSLCWESPWRPPSSS